MIIYLETILGLNFGIDLALLWMSGRCLGLRSPAWRLALGALSGALYALAVMVWPSRLIASLAAKVGVAALMLLVCYGPQPRRVWARLAGVFGLATATTAGLTLAAAAGAAGAPTAAAAGGMLILGPAATRLVPLGLLLSGMVVWIAARAMGVAARQRSWCVRAEVVVRGQTVSFRALVDTGNELREPLSGAPVLIAEMDVLAPLVPPGWRSLLIHGPTEFGRPETAVPRGGDHQAQHGPAEAEAGAEAVESWWASRIRLVPYRAVGSDRGMLVGFRPDRLLVTGSSGQRQEYREVIVAAYPHRLTPEGVYHGILPASMVA